MERGKGEGPGEQRNGHVDFTLLLFYLTPPPSSLVAAGIHPKQ